MLQLVVNRHYRPSKIVNSSGEPSDLYDKLMSDMLQQRVIGRSLSIKQRTTRVEGLSIVTTS